MTQRSKNRMAVVYAIDYLVQGTQWVGNLQEIHNEIRCQRNSCVSDYVMRSVLKEYGEYLGRGQYRVTRESFRAATEPADNEREVERRSYTLTDSRRNQDD